MKSVPFVLQLLLLGVLRPECAWALPVAIRTSSRSKNIQERFPLDCGEGSFLCHGSLSFIQKKQALVFGFLSGSVVKSLPANAGDTGSIPGWGSSLEKEMATHPSVLTQEIPWREEPGEATVHGSKESDRTQRLNNDKIVLLGKGLQLPICMQNLPVFTIMTLGFIPVSGFIKRKEEKEGVGGGEHLCKN